MTSIKACKAAARQMLFPYYKTLITAQLVMYLFVLSFSYLNDRMNTNTTLVSRILFFGITLLIQLLSGIFMLGITMMHCHLYAGEPPTLAAFVIAFQHSADKAILTEGLLFLAQSFFRIPYYIVLFQNSNDFWLLLLLSSLGSVLYFFLAPFANILYLCVADQPARSWLQSLRSSLQITSTHYKPILLLYLSMLPLDMLALLSLGIGSLWVEPYKRMALTTYYYQHCLPVHASTSSTHS